MTYKVPMYYIVKVQDAKNVWNGEEYISHVSYVAGPFSSWEDATGQKRKIEIDTFLGGNTYLKVATQYIEVEL